MRTPRLLAFTLAALTLGAPAFAGDGAALGHVLVDSTGLPLPAASVTLAGGGTTTSDTEGRYVVFGPAGAQTIVVQAAGFTSVSRPVAVSADAAVLALDARLTALAAPVAIDATGGELRTGSLLVTVPPGAVSASTEFRLTALSGQSMPARLPLGWTPARAWDLRASGAVTASLAAQATDLADGTLHLVRHDDQDHAWVMVQAGLAPTDGQLTVDLAEPGAYALVAADAAPAPPIPGPGAALTGVAAVIPSGGLTGSVRVEPALVSAAGGIGRAFVHLETGTALPSGTVFQARLEDDYLVDGEPVFEEPRVQDLVLYRVQAANGAVLEAVLPVRAVQTFPAERLVSGFVEVALWTRPGETGGVLGGADAARVEAGAFRLNVAAGSLPANTVLRLVAVAISPWVPTGPAASPLGEVVVDLSGAILANSAELSLAAPGLNPGDVVVIARVETFDATPYLQVVSLAQVVNGRAVSVPHAALPGITTGGRYVFFKLAGPVGFVRGTLSTAAGPVRAVAKSTALPFAAISATNGQYTLTATVGASVPVTAFIPHTTYQASSTVAVASGQVATLDLTLAGAATTVTVTPADGATALPVNTMVEIVASVPFNPATVTSANVRLHEGAAGGPQVAVRFVLSQGNRRVAVIPDAPLQPSQLHTLVATNLRDVYGAAVTVPNTRFTTRSDETPSYNLDRLTFSFPDEQGIVQVAATPGSFPPGSHLMILNYGNQVVLTLTVDNDGAVAGTLPATLDDSMMVTLTDPDGRTLTKNVSRYVDAATGRTAVGTFGGTVEGPNGLQLRLPEGAVQNGVVFKLEDVPPASIPVDKRPDLPGATLSSAMRITAESKPTFRKEVDLVFPKPANAPAGSFFYVYRQLQGPDGKIVYQTIDKGVVEGDRVVTASPPFSGYVDSSGGYAFNAAGQMAVSNVANNIATLMWTFDQLIPGKASAAVFSGRVTRARWDPTTQTTVYDPVPGARVRRVLLGPQPADPLGDAFASTDANGTFTFFDATFTGGLATVRATDLANGQTLDATAYATTKPPWADAFRAFATANIAFPALQQAPPPPTVAIKVLIRQDGVWRFAEDNVVVTGTDVAIGFACVNGTIQRAEVDGEQVQLQPGGPNYEGMPVVASYVVLQSGVHTIDATLVPPTGPQVVRSAVFLAVAAGGGNNAPLPGPPRVLRTAPIDGAKDTSPELMPEVVFTEPVTNVLAGDNVRLIETDTGRLVPFELSGIGPSGPVVNVVPSSVVTGLTLRPLGGLRYLTRYTISLGITIVDRDAGEPGDPKELLAHVAEFTTYQPKVIGGTEEKFPSPGLVVLNDRAYLVHNLFLRGRIRTFDISNPDQPSEVPEGTNSVDGRPVDIGGMDEGVVSSGRLIAVGTTATNHSLPSNVQLFDPSGDGMTRVGVASLTSNAVEGTLTRFTVRERYLYALTQHHGVQVLDMAQAKENYLREAADPARLFNMMRDLNTDGRGFGHDAVVRTVPVKANETTHWTLADLDAGDYTIDGVQQTLAMVTGQIGLGVVNTVTGDVRQVPLLQTADAAMRLTFGRAIALGRVGTADVAIVAGSGKVDGTDAAAVLFVVSLANPLVPQVLGAVSLSSGAFRLDGSPTDVLLRDATAIVAGPTNAVVVSLTDLTRPTVVGAVTGVGGRLQLGTGANENILFSTADSAFGGSTPLGGVRTAALGPIVLTLDKDKNVLPKVKLPKNTDVYVAALGVEGGDTIEGVEVSIIEKDGSVRRQSGSIPTQKTLTLTRDAATGKYLAPLKIVDKDCALNLNESGDEATTPCVGDLESGPWTRLDIKLPATYGRLERTSDIRAFRIANLGDSITHGVQEGIVVHEDQVDSYPAQLARQVDKLLGARDKDYNQQQTIFTQALIDDPGSPPIPPLGKVYDADGDGGRLNPQVHPVNNLGLSGAQIADLYTAKVGNYPLVDDDGSLVCYQDGSYCNPKASRHVWPLVLGREAGTVGATPIPSDGTAVDAAGKLDATLLIVYAGGNDVLGAARNADLKAITDPAVFRENYKTLVEKTLATGTRADIVVATVPDVETVPHMILVGGKVGDLPFTVPLSFLKRLVGALLGVSEETATHALETSVLASNDPDGGVYPPGTLTSLSVLAREEVIDRADKRHFLPTKLHLKSQGERKDVLTPDQLEQIRQTVAQFNQIIRDIAQKHGFAVADINALLRDRVTNATSPARLNGLRTGTLRAQPGDDGIQRGIGNSLFCWDGIHPNGAGYSLMANEFIKAINARLAEADYGGLSKGDRIPLITGASAGGAEDQITPLLMKYLTLKRTRIQREVTGVE